MAKKRISKLLYYKDKKGEWRWTFSAPNGRKVACCGEGYSGLNKAKKGFNSFKHAVQMKGTFTIEHGEEIDTRSYAERMKVEKQKK